MSYRIRDLSKDCLVCLHSHDNKINDEGLKFCSDTCLKEFKLKIGYRPNDIYRVDNQGDNNPHIFFNHEGIDYLIILDKDYEINLIMDWFFIYRYIDSIHEYKAMLNDKRIINPASRYVSGQGYIVNLIPNKIVMAELLKTRNELHLIKAEMSELKSMFSDFIGMFRSNL